ncbi:MAG: CopZ family metallochaperone [bacterium]|jgi:copper chaperone CopZ
MSTTTALQIDGMKCQGCVSAVTDALKAVPGVQGAEVNLDEKSARVEGEASPESLIQAVQQAGFSASTEAA